MPKLARLLLTVLTLAVLTLAAVPAGADPDVEEGWCRKDVDYITTQTACLAEGGEWFGSSVPPNG